MGSSAVRSSFKHSFFKRQSMDRIFLILIGFAVVPFSYAATPLVTIEYVTVGDTDNPRDAAVMVTDGTSGYGKVDYVFQIGKYEVTCAQYAAFLNAKAKSDPYKLYDPINAGNIEGGGIIRTGTDGNF